MTCLPRRAARARSDRAGRAPANGGSGVLTDVSEDLGGVSRCVGAVGNNHDEGLLFLWLGRARIPRAHLKQRHPRELIVRELASHQRQTRVVPRLAPRAAVVRVRRPVVPLRLERARADRHLLAPSPTTEALLLEPVPGGRVRVSVQPGLHVPRQSLTLQLARLHQFARLHQPCRRPARLNCADVISSTILSFWAIDVSKSGSFDSVGRVLDRVS